MTTHRSSRFSRIGVPLLAGLATVLGLPVNAAVVLPDVPLQFSRPLAPNIMFILDDSGSMTWDFMPGAFSPAEIPATTPIPIQARASTRNTLYYDPAITYLPWNTGVTPTERMTGGTSYTAAFSSDVLATVASGTINLQNSVQTYYVPKTATSDESDATQYYRYQIMTDGRVWRSELQTPVATAVTTTNTQTISAGNFGTTLQVTVPANSGTFTVTTSGGTGDGDLYIRRGAAPTTGTYNCRSQGGTNAELCTFDPSTTDTTYYIRVLAYTAVNNIQIATSYFPGLGDGCSGGGWINCTEARPPTPTKPSGRTVAEELTNYATWYSYHRTRMKTAKAGATLAFADMDGEKHRVGFKTIWGPGTSDGPENPEFLIPVGTNDGLFTGTNRSTWYSRLTGATAQGGTPLLSALRDTGNYYSDATNAGPYGGTLNAAGGQYQCRQNFAILTTDGYWNSTARYTSGTPVVGNADGVNGTTYQPLKPDGTADASKPVYGYTAARPYSATEADTLADVAMHYWKTDLRDNLINTVSTSTADPAFWQHMVTFGISIGLSGTVDQSTVADVVAAGGPTINGTAVDWPNPLDTEDQERIDDLLHAAVNGHGEFVAASNPTAFATGLRAALAKIADTGGSRSNIVANGTSINASSRVYQSTYDGDKWSGELTGYQVTSSGVNLTTNIIRATEGLQSPTASTFFTWNGTAGASFPTTAQNALLGTNVADYLKGSTAAEIANGGTFRTRTTRLGDIVHSSPTFMKGATTAQDTVFVGANDGMLHAFKVSDLTERFAYVPASLDMNVLKTLSSPTYAHKFFVDGPIVVSDRKQSITTTYPTGRNILVGFLGRGGKGLFGLDVTNPESFAATNVLWDKSAADYGMASGEDGTYLGKVIAQPFMTKLNNGQLGVVFGNGPESTTNLGALFIVNAETGAVIKRIAVPGANNALSAPRGWDEDGDGDVDLVYAGDLLGNVWKFDLSSSNTNGWGVASLTGGGSGDVPLFKAVDANGKIQPITGGISVAVDPNNGYKRWVFVGTGSVLTSDDVSNANIKDVQSWYGLIDGTSVVKGRGVTPGGVKERTIAVIGTDASGQKIRGFEPNAMLNAGSEAYRGWFIDLKAVGTNTAEGERMIGTNMVVNGILIAGSGVPSNDPCNPIGDGYVYALDAFTGTSVPSGFFDLNGDGNFGNDVVGTGTAQVPIGGYSPGIGMVGNPVLQGDVLTAGGTASGFPAVDSTKIKNSNSVGRISWREILKD